jgi:hypothetical protein
MANSWLFTRDAESVYICRIDGRRVVVAGPGTARHHVDFTDEESLQRYQIMVAEDMAKAGWILYATDRQRRSASRPTTVADRRQPIA